jgi:hypothetical protein
VPSTEESSRVPEDPRGRHVDHGFAASGLASGTLSRAALRARPTTPWYEYRWVANLVPLIGFCHSNEPRAHHEHLQPRKNATGQLRLPSDEGEMLNAPALASRFTPFEGS